MSTSRAYQKRSTGTKVKRVAWPISTARLPINAECVVPGIWHPCQTRQNEVEMSFDMDDKEMREWIAEGEDGIERIWSAYAWVLKERDGWRRGHRKLCDEFLVQCYEDEYHYTLHSWECLSLGSSPDIHFRCKHCGEDAKMDKEDDPLFEGIHLEEYGGCEVPREGEWNQDGRMCHHGKWWKRLAQENER